MTIDELVDTLVDPSFQKVDLYSLSKDEVVFTGTADEIPQELLYEEIYSIDCIEKNSDVLTINIEGEE